MQILTQRLDEEQAERIRQGARAESLEEDLEALRLRRGEELEEKRTQDSHLACYPQSLQPSSIDL